MLRYEAETFSVAQGPTYGLEKHALLMAVDGTHSAGKTTVIRDYLADKELLVDEAIDDFGQSHEHNYPVVCVSETVGDTTVPIVVVGEIARQLDAFYPDRNMLTTGYNLDDQASITLRTISRTQGAGMSALAMAEKFQPHRKNPVGVVLTDRGVLSGFSYASARLPGKDYEYVDLAKVSDISTPSYKVNIADQASAFAARYDKVLLTDHTEIHFEDDGKRIIDDDMRNFVAKSIAETYINHIAADKIVNLNGDRAMRLAELSRQIRGLIEPQLEF